MFSVCFNKMLLFIQSSEYFLILGAMFLQIAGLQLPEAAHSPHCIFLLVKFINSVTFSLSKVPVGQTNHLNTKQLS